MKNLSSLFAITALANAQIVQAFAPSSRECAGRTQTDLCATSNSRRNFLSTTIATAATVAVSTLVLTPLPSFADLSDGNALPEGMAQFTRVLKVRVQLQAVAKRVTENPDEIDKKEWDKIDDFLRTVYSAGQDMKVVSKGIFDPVKKKQADEDIKTLQNLVQAAQKPVSKKDAAGFGFIANKADGLFGDFLEQLSDVPDEL